MMYYCYYGCSVNEQEEVIESESLEEAEKYVYEKAVENFQSYEGLHGISSFEEFVEENSEFYENDEDDLREAYHDYMENDINYGIEIFDAENFEHAAVLESQEGEVYYV